jgi:hypothetical protein
MWDLYLGRIVYPCSHESLFKSSILHDVELACGLLCELWSSILCDVSSHVVVRYCGLSKEWYGGKGCGLHSLWLVLLELAKDRLLGVDTPELSVPPRVQYEMTCLLISDTSESSLAWRMASGHL